MPRERELKPPMPRFAPKILDGTRGPRADRLDDMRAMADSTPEQPHEMPKVDGTVYLSPYPSYCVQVTAPDDLKDPVTGRKTVGRPTKALFQEGRYVNNARDPKLRKFIDETLQSNTRFGRPGSGADYWLAEDAVRMAQAAAKAGALATLRSIAKQSPEELTKFLSELQQGDATDAQMPAVPSAPGVEA